MLLLAINAAATVRYVNVNNATPSQPYTNWATAATSIQNAINAAAAGDLVLVTNGIYQSGGRRVFGTLTNRVAVTKPLVLRSVNGPEVTIIRGRKVPGTVIGDSAVRCVYLTNGAVMTGFTLTNGATRELLGDYFLEASGGGAYCASNVVVSNCIFRGNTAFRLGGGVSGGTLNNCMFSENVAGSGGGAVYATLNNCIFTNNSTTVGASGHGGGAYDSVLNNCFLRGNTADWGGGGMNGGTASNCTIVENTARFGGGAANCALYNSIIYYNAALDRSNYYNETLNYCCTVPAYGTSFTNVPLFINQAAGNFRLLDLSLCVNAGNNAYAPVGSDLDGKPRIVGTGVDLGAYELQTPFQLPPGPYTHTRPATSIRSNSATLNGVVVPRGLPSSAWFEWGQNGVYDFTTATQSVGSGNELVQVNVDIAGLLPQGIYQFRLVSSNLSGVVHGPAQKFTTGRRVYAWGDNTFGQTNVPAGLSNAVAVAGGGSHSLALKSDGTVVGWGYNYYRQINVPAGLSNILAVAAGGTHSLALKADGTVVAWGDHSYGQAFVPVGLSNVVAIAGGGTGSLALKSDGTVVAWDYNYFDQTNIPPGLTNVVAVDAGDDHNLALQADGTVVAWGKDYFGQANVPPGLGGVVSVAAGSDHSLALRADGLVVAWGDNSAGQSSVPPGLSNVLSISAGGYHSLALTLSGVAVPWGTSYFGVTTLPHGLTNLAAFVSAGAHALAIGSRIPEAFAQNITAPLNDDVVIELKGFDEDGDVLAFRISNLPAVGDLYQFADGVRGALITTNGTVVSDNSGRVIFAPVPGQTGNPHASFSFVAGDGQTESTPATVTVRIVAASPFAHTQLPTFAAAGIMKLNGMVTPNGLPSTAWFEWGERGNYTQTTSPLNVGNGVGVAHVSVTISNLSAGPDYQCRLVISNALGVARGVVRLFGDRKRVRAWGDNGYGQTNLPVGLSNVVMVAAGEYHNLVLKSDGTVAAWGWNGLNQTNVPAGLSNVVMIAGGFYQNLALKADGSLVAWGSHWDRSTATPVVVPTGLTNVVALAAGRSHSVALKADGTVAVWGVNNFSQTNVPAGLSNVVEIAAGAEITIAIKNDGTVVAWGNGESGRTNVPAGLSNVVAATGTFYAAWVLKADGGLAAWGDNLNGHWDINYPFGVTNLIAISAGGLHVLGLKDDGTALGWGYDTSGLGIAGVPQGISNLVAVAAGNSHNLVLLDNTPPQAFDQTVIGPASLDLVVSLNANDVNADVLSYRVTTLPSAGTLHQYVGGTRGAMIASPNTIVTDPLGRVVFALTPNEFSVPDVSFSFVANDGDADSSPAVVTVNIVATAPFANTQAATQITTNTATLNGMATPNGLSSMAWFEWGTNTSYGQSTGPQAVGGGLSVAHVMADIAGLERSQTYRCRLVVSNQSGVTFGAPQLFRTGGNVTAWGSNGSNRTNVPPGLHGVTTLGAGSLHSVVLRTDGSIAGWGFNGVGQLNLPAGLSNVATIVSGSDHGLVLLSDGTLTSWGSNLGGERNIPAGLSNVVDIAAGYRKSAAILANGQVNVWGELNVEITSAVPTFSNVVAVSPSVWSSPHLLVLLHDGTVRAAGYDFNGQTDVPPGLSNVVAVAAGGSHSLALRRDGTVVGWGSDGSGQATPPPGLTNVIAIDAGASHSLALRADGTVVMWGALLDGGVDISSALSNVSAISAGESHNLALIPNRPPTAQSQLLSGAANSDLVIQLSGSDPDSDPLTFRVQSLPASGSLYQFTNGTRGVLITSNETVVTDSQRRLVFVPAAAAIGNPYDAFTFAADDGEAVSTSANVTITIIGYFRVFTRPATEVHEAGAKLNGFVAPNGFPTTAWFEWGTNMNYGQTSEAIDGGSGSSVVHLTHPINALSSGQVIHFRLVASNPSTVVYGMDQQFIAGGRAVAWGDNSSGQSLIPPGIGKVAVVAGGLTHSVGLRTDGTLAAWGNNADGQAAIPAGVSNVAAVAAGGFHNVALLMDGDVVAWGRNSSGQTNVPPGLSNVVSVAAGGLHSLALRGDGSVSAWGYNSHGQATVPAGLSNVVSVAAGWYHSVALRSDGTVRVWGNNTFNQTNIPAGLSNVVWIGAGLYHTLTLHGNGTISAWGYNGSSQTNVPGGLINAVAAAAGGSHNFALRPDGSLEGWGYNFYGQTTVPAGLSNVISIAGGGTHSLAIIPDHGPTALPQNIAGYVNHDLVVTLQGADPDGDALVYTIHSLPDQGVLYQYADGIRGAGILSAETVVSDVAGRLVFAPGTNGLGSPYTELEFRASDGSFDSAPAVVAITILLAPIPEFDSASSGWSTNGGFQLAFSGGTNAVYLVWASSNLVDWEPLGVATTILPGSFQFLDSSATNWPQRFYRAVAP